MHGSPTTEQKYLFVNQNRISIYSFGLFSTLCIFIGNAVFLYHFPYFIPALIVFIITAVYLSMSYLVGFMGRGFDIEAHRKLVTKWIDRSEIASVDIYLPVCGEPYSVIENTWRHVKELALSYCNVKVYVLDDKQDESTQEMAREFGFRYITRSTNELKKAGNLRNAFTKTNGEFIVIFDADFCPRKDFLLETLPYLFERENLSIVQTAQFFDVRREYSWIKNGAGAVQELFYRLIQTNRDTFGGAICVGTNAVYRRKHLEPFGGTAPIPYSEDVHTGFQCLMAGHEIKYLPLNLALGACPDTLKQFFTQQYRWSLGSLSLMLSRKFWQTKITVMQRICYMTGMFFYVATGIGAVTYFLPSFFLLIFYPDRILWYSLLFSVPSFLFSTCFMSAWMRLPFGVNVLRTRQVSYFAHLFALKDRLLNTLEEWKPTGASFNSVRYDQAARLYTAVALFVPLVTFSLVLLRIYEGQPAYNFTLLCAFTTWNAYVSCGALDDL
jgi:cellulose synthase/poly-beta-1,6-N-acetylglucosamine synthase-like glycosyltransferase